MHDILVSSGTVDVLGVELEGDANRTRVQRDRLLKSRQAIGGVLQRRHLSGQVLEILVGNLTFIALVQRGALSIFHNVYKYMHAHYLKPARLWNSVREELVAFRGIMVLLVSDWWLPWRDHVVCSDASETGFGVCTSDWPAGQAAICGRVQERSRFRRASGLPARASAKLAQERVVDHELNEDEAGHDDWVIDESFPEVDSSLLAFPKWTPVLWGHWHKNEDIFVLESRALTKAVKAFGAF